MTFRDLVGHRTTLGLISRALDAGTLPPSLIFGGPDGVGKRQVAIALAQALNCLSPVRPAPWADGSAPPLAIDACGECPPAGVSRAACIPTSGSWSPAIPGPSRSKACAR